MAYFSGTPVQLPNGANLWFGDAVVTLSTDGTYQTGDFLMDVSPSGAVLYYCSAGGKPGTWVVVAKGSDNVVTKAANYTLNALTDDTCFLTANATITLPAATGLAGKRFTVKRFGAGDGSVAGAIDGGSTGAAFGTDKACITVESDGTAWRAISTLGTVTISQAMMPRWKYTNGGELAEYTEDATAEPVASDPATVEPPSDPAPAEPE